MNGWINIYKPRGISSARSVSMVKRAFKGDKVGHTGTLDLEAEGVLPIAIGEATKLVSILIDAKKQYAFTVKFGTKTDTADSAGKIIGTTKYIPSKEECDQVCFKFLGVIEQTPPAYSALKVGGQRAYKLAREGKDVQLAKRNVTIYNLQCTSYNKEQGTADYLCECSKGTYIRTLAEDISLSLQSLGFVVELRRLKVGMFDADSAIDISRYAELNLAEVTKLLQDKCLRVEGVLDDIPVLEASNSCTKLIRFGQKCQFNDDQNYDLVWIRNNAHIVAVGSLFERNFKSSRVFNL
jgi:tRNA pseudouridine55 synthase